MLETHQKSTTTPPKLSLWPPSIIAMLRNDCSVVLMSEVDDLSVFVRDVLPEDPGSRPSLFLPACPAPSCLRRSETWHTLPRIRSWQAAVTARTSQLLPAYSSFKILFARPSRKRFTLLQTKPTLIPVAVGTVAHHFQSLYAFLPRISLNRVTSFDTRPFPARPSISFTSYLFIICNASSRLNISSIQVADTSPN